MAGEVPRLQGNARRQPTAEKGGGHGARSRVPIVRPESQTRGRDLLDFGPARGAVATMSPYREPAPPKPECTGDCHAACMEYPCRLTMELSRGRRSL